jgi:hypothetical protein
MLVSSCQAGDVEEAAWVQSPVALMKNTGRIRLKPNERGPQTLQSSSNTNHKM